MCLLLHVVAGYVTQLLYSYCVQINTDADAAPTWAHPDNHIILEAPTPSVDPSVCITHNFISEPNSVTFKPTPKLSMQMDQESSYNNLSIMGTQGYMAPEMAYGDGHYTKNIDWWTLGMYLCVSFFSK